MRFMDNLDLFKSKRDTSKLVQVQRTVSRQGTTFVQNFWVKPSDVKSTDKVIGGQQNLLPKIGSVPKPASGVLDAAYFDSIKSDKKLALDYLKSCGLTWSEHSHPAINWMRAMQSYSAAQGGAISSQKQSSQVNAQPQTKTQQSPQKSQAGKDTQDVVLTSTQKDELDSGSNGKEKTVILKKLLGNDKCVQYAKQLGVTWEEHSHPAINIMRMSMALKDYFDVADGTVSPAGVSKKKGGGAPKDNKNAKKDATVVNTPPKDETLLDIPKNATESQRNIITLLNSITEESELETYSSVGMVPEDDVSKSFIMSKLAPKYALFKAAHSISTSSGKKTRHNSNNPSGFADQLAYDVGFQGCKKDVLGQGFEQLYRDFDMGLLVAPRDCITSDLVTSRAGVMRRQNLSHILDNLSQYSTYATEEYDDDAHHTPWATTLGYKGWDSDVYKSRYSHDNEGFIKVLTRISKENPDLKPKCDHMIEQYDKLMEVVDYNPNVLTMYLNSNNWFDADDDKVQGRVNFDRFTSDASTSHYSMLTPAEADITLRTVKYQVKAIPEALKSLGYTDEDIKKTFSGWNWYNTTLKSFDITKADGTMDSIDLTAALDPSGEPYFNSDRDNIKYTYTNHVVLDMIRDELEGTQRSDGKKWIQQAEVISHMTFDKFKQVHAMTADIFGLKYTQPTDGEDVDWAKVNSGNISDYLDNSGHVGEHGLESIGEDSQLDKVIANIHMMNVMHDVNKNIAERVSDNPRNKVNDFGQDYSKNFNYYYADNRYIRSNDRRLKVPTTSSWDPVFSSAKEMNDQIEKQIAAVPMMSSAQLEDIMSYYSAASNFTDAGSAARKATFRSVGIDFPEYKDSPLKDILFKTTTSVAGFIPKMAEKSSTRLADSIAKKLDYVPYDYHASVQHTYSELHGTKKTVTAAQADNKLRQLRQSALKAVHCTVAVEDEDTSLQMRKEFMKNWDYDGVNQPKIYSGSNSYQGADRRALFNSRFFKIKNSSFEQPFQDYVTKLGQTPEEHYHATSYASTAGILGAIGGWMIGKKYIKTAQALGPGAYFGRKGGKSSVYCGEGQGGYHNLYADGDQGDRANGCYILTSLIQGEPNDSTVSNSFREYEIVVRNNSCLLPHHFVDISCRALGVNVKRDAAGNYLDKDGNVTHDRYGKKIDME